MRTAIVVTTLLLGLAACQPSNKEEKSIDGQEKVVTEQERSLSSILDEKKQRFLQRADSAKIIDYDAGLKAVEETGILRSALNVGDTAKDFELTDQNGTKVSLHQLLEEGPVVLTWYRGGWCPYCNITLAYLQEKLPEFEAVGAHLVAISPELPDSSLSTIEKNQLSFTVLSDMGNAVARQYGVVFKLTYAVAQRYQNGFDLNAYNGDKSDELPLAATYVIDVGGVIQYAFLDVDYRNRAEPNDILNALEALN